MKYLLLSLVLVVGSVSVSGCASTDEIRQNVTALEQAIATVEAENTTLRNELQAVADAGGNDSDIAQKIADALAKNDKWLDEAKKALAVANTALADPDADSEDVVWELARYGAEFLGFGALVGVAHRMRKRQKQLTGVVSALENNRERESESGDLLTFRKTGVRNDMVKLGIISDVEAIRKEVKA